MIPAERIPELITFHKQNLRGMEAFAETLGGGPMVEVTKKIARDLITDTITALEEYQNMASVKKLVDGG